MAISKAKIGGGSLLCLTFCSFLLGQERHQQRLDKSCQEFVSTFYTWYLGEAVVGVPGEATSDLALKDRPYVFSSDLYQQLSEDSEAQRKAPGELVGLDFDPFIGPDGPAERYIVEKVTTRDGRCWAEVHAAWNGIKNAATDVTPEPELVFKGGRWIFVNFHYHDPARPGQPFDLLTELKELRKSREQEKAMRGKKP